MAARRLINGIWELGPPTPAYRLRPAQAKTVIHEGRDSRTGAPVSILLVRPPWCESPAIREIYRFGVDKVRNLDHPNIMRTLDVVDEPGALGTVSEPLPGDDVHRLVQRGAATFTEADVVRVLRQLAAALEHAHGRGVIFGTVRPSNVELTPDRVVKLSAMPKPPCRFTNFLEAADYLGYPRSCAPEVIRCEPLDERTDVYGLGLTAYEMVVSLVSNAPRGHLGNELNAAVSEELPAPSSLVEDIDPLLDSVIRRCLRLDRTQRYPSAAAVRQDLDRIQGKRTCLISQARLREIIEVAFPAPLALLVRSLEREDHLHARRDKLLNLAGGLVNYLGFTAAAALGEPLPREFGRPSLGHWVGLMRKTCRAAEPPWPFSEIGGTAGAADEMLKGLDELVRLRNESAHSAAPGEGPALYQWVERMTAAVRQACKNCLFLAQYALVSVRDLDFRDGCFLLTLDRLDGCEETAPRTAATAEPATKNRVHFAAADFSRRLSLHPWIVRTQCPLCLQEELFFYVTTQRGEVRYVTPDRGHTWSCPVPPDWPIADA
ncbi:MAG TPA: protein kinase [Gemmataceae bacterium]|jgi:serine/threonine-protein kinase|nr:protein kinase [Gemmataceae bacterium]